MAVKRSRKTRKTAGKTRKIKRAKKLAKRSKRAVKSSNLKSAADVGKLTLRQYVNAKRNAKQEEIKKYEQQYLARYKQPKSGVMKPKSWTESDVDLGKLNLRQYINAKRTAKQEEIKKYEKQYLARYKQPKAGLKKSESYLHMPEEPKQDIKKERKDYESEYISKFKKLQKTKLKIAALEQKLRLSQIELEEPKQDVKKERKDYEKEYLTQYKKQQKSKPKKKASIPLEPKPKPDIKKDPEDRDAVLKAWQRTQNIYGYSQQKSKPEKRASKPLEQEPKTDGKEELKKYEN